MSESPPTAPVCYRHPSRETWVRCTRCDRAICPDCMRDASVGHQCPECVAEGRRTQRPARTAFGGSAAGRHGYVTKTLVGLNVIVALLGVAFAGVDALIPRGGFFSGLTSFQAAFGTTGIPWTVFPGGQFAPGEIMGGTVYPGIFDGGFYRLFTAMFVHYGIIHLAFNMWALWMLGRNLETVLGPWRFGALYLIAGLGGNVAAFLISPFGGVGAGASTAVFGLFAAFFIVLRRLGQDTRQIMVLLVINLVITFTLPGISWEGHLGGLVTGGLVAAILAYAPRANRTLVQVAGVSLVLIALIGLTLIRISTGPTF